jgi:hypothetical protein
VKTQTPACKYEPQFFRSPISIPASKSGKVEVTHRALTDSAIIVGMRQAILRGMNPVKARLSSPLTIHELREGGSIWMTDLPEELNQIGEMLHDVQPHGRVLVGGLGLGIVAKMVSENQDVDEVIVVERNADVIKLCEDASAYEVVHSDIYKYMKKHKEPFDFYLLDTWAGTSENTWWTEVLPLRRTIRQRFGPKPVIHCWAEDIMIGQVKQVLCGPHRVWKYEGFPLMSEVEVEIFLSSIGLPSWEKKYGKIIDAQKRIK